LSWSRKDKVAGSSKWLFRFYRDSAAASSFETYARSL
jgi:hypothetical protein